VPIDGSRVPRLQEKSKVSETHSKQRNTSGSQYVIMPRWLYIRQDEISIASTMVTTLDDLAGSLRCGRDWHIWSMQNPLLSDSTLGVERVLRPSRQALAQSQRIDVDRRSSVPSAQDNEAAQLE